MSEKVLIVGANGHLGHVVVETALEKGYQVRAADITLDRLDSVKHPGLERVKADITKKETLIPAYGRHQGSYKYRWPLA